MGVKTGTQLGHSGAVSNPTVPMFGFAVNAIGYSQMGNNTFLQPIRLCGSPTLLSLFGGTGMIFAAPVVDGGLGFTIDPLSQGSTAITFAAPGTSGLGTSITGPITVGANGSNATTLFFNDGYTPNGVKGTITLLSGSHLTFNSVFTNLNLTANIVLSGGSVFTGYGNAVHSGTLTVPASCTISHSFNFFTLAGAVSIATASTLTATCTQSGQPGIIFSGVISGAGNLEHTSSGVCTGNFNVRLSGANTCTGTLSQVSTVGILQLAGSWAGAGYISNSTMLGQDTTSANSTISGAVTITNNAGSTLRPGLFGNNTFNTGALTISGTNSRVTFDSTTTTLSKVNVTGTCALGGCGLIFPAGITTNGTYDLIVASGTMSGTLPSITTNSTGKTLVLAQVGNTLRVTVS